MLVVVKLCELVSQIPNQIQYYYLIHIYVAVVVLLMDAELMTHKNQNINNMYKETTDNTPIFRYIQRMADGVTSVLVRTVFGAVLGTEKIFNCHSQFKSIKSPINT